VVTIEIQLASSCEKESKNKFSLCGCALFCYRAGDQSSIDESIPKNGRLVEGLGAWTRVFEGDGAADRALRGSLEEH